jgi:hypothetical protein
MTAPTLTAEHICPECGCECVGAVEALDAARATDAELREAAQRVAAEYGKLRVEAGSPWLDKACADLALLLSRGGDR